MALRKEQCPLHPLEVPLPKKHGCATDQPVLVLVLVMFFVKRVLLLMLLLQNLRAHLTPFA